MRGNSSQDSFTRRLSQNCHMQRRAATSSCPTGGLTHGGIVWRHRRDRAEHSQRDVIAQDRWAACRRACCHIGGCTRRPCSTMMREAKHARLNSLNALRPLPSCAQCWIAICRPSNSHPWRRHNAWRKRSRSCSKRNTWASGGDTRIALSPRADQSNLSCGSSRRRSAAFRIPALQNGGLTADPPYGLFRALFAASASVLPSGARMDSRPNLDVSTHGTECYHRQRPGHP
jgi:hypothetical protein